MNTDKPKFRSGKFKEAAREIGADEARWDDRLRMAVKHKPQPEKPE